MNNSNHSAIFSLDEILNSHPPIRSSPIRILGTFLKRVAQIVLSTGNSQEDPLDRSFRLKMNRIEKLLQKSFQSATRSGASPDDRHNFAILSRQIETAAQILTEQYKGRRPDPFVGLYRFTVPDCSRPIFAMMRPKQGFISIGPHIRSAKRIGSLP